MPELPEVEREARLLASALVGRTIAGVTVRDARVVLGNEGAFRRALVGKRVERVERIGKHIVAHLSSGELFWTHLRMTGCFVPLEKAERARFVLRCAMGGIAFVDPRCFGKTAAGPAERVRRIAHLDRVGPDALTHGRRAATLGAALAGARGPIKAVLLDQSRLAGLGNLHAAEALFRARLHPATRTTEVVESAELLRRLARGIRAALEFGLRDVMREDFAYLHQGAPSPFFVYDRKGEPCKRCRTPISRIVIAGRGTYFCTHCQRREKPDEGGLPDP